MSTNVLDTPTYFPCDSCGFELNFEPGKEYLTCPNCGHAQTLPQASDVQRKQALQEYDFQTYADADPHAQTPLRELSTTDLEVQCENCGAEILFQPPIIADSCPFCGTHIVVGKAHAAGMTILPGGVVPFKVGRKQATQALKDWLRFRWDWDDLEALFIRGELRKVAHQKLSGVYLPFWTFDAQANITYDGERGTNHTILRRDSDGELCELEEIRWQPVSGETIRTFDDVLVAATRKVDRSRLNALWRGIDMADVEPYDPRYLAGFKAQRYQIPLKAGFHLAEDEMKPAIRRKVEGAIGGDSQRIHNISVTYSDQTFRLLLMPVWLASYRFGKKVYQVMVNAQTGQILGERPLSAWKVTLGVIVGSIVAITVVIGAVAFLIYAITE